MTGGSFLLKGLTMADTTNLKQSPDLEVAMRYWADNMKVALDQKFGKDKVGHLLILFPFGHSGQISWISNARTGSLIGMLRQLADHLESPNAKIIRPH